MKQELSKEHLIKLITEITSRMNETPLIEKNHQIPVGISNRHIHLCEADIEKLFGAGYELILSLIHI